MNRQSTKVGEQVNRCSKMFSKALIRIITANIPEEKKLEYLDTLYKRIDEIEKLQE